MDIPGYNLVRAYHSANAKRGGVYIYFRKFLPLRILDIHFHHECMNFEMRIFDKVCNFISLYRSPNQSLEEFEIYILDIITKYNPFLIVLLGDLNAKLSKLYKKDSTSYEVTKIDGVTSQFGMQQLINEPTDQLTQEPIQLYIKKSHHQIIYAKLNLKIHYPPLHERETWHYKYANTDFLQRAINYYPWKSYLAEKNVNEKVYTFAKTIKNIFPNFIPHETILCDDRDPPWTSKKIQNLINEKNTAYQSYIQNG